MKHLPNALTLLRLVLAPVVAWFFLEGVAAAMTPGQDVIRRLEFVVYNQTVAAALFIVAALTDLFDGMIARAFDAHSKFGRLIDPIADKAIVGLPLIAIVVAMWLDRSSFWPIAAFATAVIVIRDVSMTLIRLSSPDGEGAPVSSLAKLKTALELIVVGSALGVSALVAHLQVQDSIGDTGFVVISSYVEAFEWVWLLTLVMTAALSAWTAWQYLRPAKTIP